jgi:hypothetical protein
MRGSDLSKTERRECTKQKLSTRDGSVPIVVREAHHRPQVSGCVRPKCETLTSKLRGVLGVAGDSGAGHDWLTVESFGGF